MTDAAQRTINGVLAVGKDGEWHLKCPACMKAPCGCADARPMTVAEAAKVLRDAMDGTDIEALTAFMRAADAMIVEQGKGLGPVPMLSAALRALSQGEE